MGEQSPILWTRGISRAFKGFLALDQVDLRIERDTVHALIGPNGAGKTTCFNLLSGFLSPSQGQIFFDGEEITGLAPEEVARRGIVRSFQISAIFSQQTVLDNIRIALQKRQGESFAFWRTANTVKVLDPEARDLAAAVGLSAEEGVRAGSLSYGKKRALEIATTLALQPKLMLLDEPTAGMGMEDIARTVDLIRRIARERTIVIVEHNLSIVKALSHRVTVLARGRILADGSYDEVAADSRVVEAYMGT